MKRKQGDEVLGLEMMEKLLLLLCYCQFLLLCLLVFLLCIELLLCGVHAAAAAAAKSLQSCLTLYDPIDGSP